VVCLLLNKSSGKKIIPSVKFARTSWQRLKGLMFENKDSFDYALVFELPSESVLQASVHMLFVFFPIDIVFLDRKKKVVDIARALQPFTPNFSPKKPAKFFVELPFGKADGIKEGDFLDWS